MRQLNGQILQQLQTLRDFPIHYLADEFGNNSNGPVDQQNGVFCERPLTGTEIPEVHQASFQFAKVVQQRQKGVIKLKGMEDKRQKGYKLKANKYLVLSHF